ncbi:MULTISPECIES: SusC/RagA family TonB-linked outer membrane protein [Elizabethkingia]|uniref:SusC/RagA family TonB-linked outer membrane protein n=1 Tax=Elizabethkingia TaxID=308865 RepID=UPI0009C318FA|nr:MULTISPECIES: SusC/RagA family TonB-linked outer membrane protein [Elizabethkingia]AQX90580.1 hypothetical protein AYC67_16855 [Elizabethkingia anophelis]EHM7981727.1 SusC/RagA family TonB-linked outer membrane protein [Elizabethkingia anophelis]EHM8032225.1 SusC/RagA family TonB-linked outer membrane protein [Elizabethkingia anophelis]EHZ9535179.1 SusC/RagA family TonB-linked outer membrane protein [Elizabethkingia anophelis]EKU3673089.1 SusC/RagA family TonB-linked outer membrane protein 
MKKFIILPFTFSVLLVSAQERITGRVLHSTTQNPLSGIQIQLLSSDHSGYSDQIVLTDHSGSFNFIAKGKNIKLKIKEPGYREEELGVNLPQEKPLVIYLRSQEGEKETEIAGVNISTGYQKIPKERATGSFSSVDQKLLSQQVSTGILERLPAIANGLSVSKGLNENGQLLVRGLSTMQGPKSPLIVVDNFPYEGDIRNINPNMVESVSILKDAAASSIWGARAANGVIVITTKSSKFNRPLSVEFSTNISLSPKPDLEYSRQMSSRDFIDMEKELFKRGYYNSDINSPNYPVLTPVVDLLNKEKKGVITSEEVSREIERLKQIDVRDQYLKYMYQPLENRQYALGISGGSSDFSWTSFAGFDDNSGNLGEKYQRLNLRFQNTWKPFSKLTITTGMYFTNTYTKSGRSAYNSISMKGSWKVPYLEFADPSGSAFVMNSILNQDYKNAQKGKGLLDWNYYPLTDWRNNEVKTSQTEILFNAGVNYKIIKGLDVDLKYQYQRVNGQNNSLYDENSYYARNYVNNFAKANSDGSISFIVPKGGILDKGNTLSDIHNLRGQLNFSRSFGKHDLSGILGGEIRESSTGYETNRYYGYNSHNLSVAGIDYTRQYPNYVTGGMDYIQKGISLRDTNLRFVSLYSNAAYTYDKKYSLSLSVRRDASNLFGLKTNDQWNPFWSMGLSWDLSREKFYKVSWLPYLKFRGSYGYNGNIDPAMVAVTTIAYNTDLSVYTGERMARIDKYYNPNLRWEMLRMINIGVDFGLFNNRITGSVEYYTKKGSNLFGQAPIDYTTGIKTMLWNIAGMSGRGMDIELKTKNLDKSLKWNSILNFSVYHDKVTSYYLPTTFASNFVTQSGSTVPISGVEGLPVYSVFAYKWGGLDPKTGDPQGYLDGKLSKEYSKITGSDKGIEDLEYYGSAIPTTFGSVINSFSFKGFSLDIGISYKLGYWIRRSSVNYTNLITGRDGHSDYGLRWQNSGDELFTSVPSNLYVSNSARDNFYNGSGALVEKGDHIRLEYITFGYHLPAEVLKALSLKSLQLYFSANNLGILWRRNTSGIDPDYNWGTYSLRPARLYSFGLRAQF